MIQNARPHRRQVGAGEDVEHLQPIGRADLDRQLQHGRRVVDIAAESDVRHEEVLVHQELENLSLALRKLQPLRNLLGDPPAHFAVVLVKALS